MKDLTLRSFLLVFVFLLCFSTVLSQKKTLRLGLVMDCPNSSAEGFLNLILQETRVLMESDYELILASEDRLQSDCDAGRIKENLDRLLADNSIDIILGIDAVSSHVMAKNGPYRKPVIAGTIINVQVQQIPIKNDGSSGVKNLAYLELPFSPMRDLEVYQSLIGFNNLGVIIDESVFAGIPEIKTFLDQGLDELGASHSFVFTQTSAEETIASIADTLDAVYLFPSDNLTDSEYQELIEGINQRGLLSFSILGRLDVDRGVLAGMAPLSNLPLIARRLALNIQRIANGEDPEDLNVKLLHQEELVLNMATARQIDYSPSWETLSEAVLINEERDDIDRTISIFDAIAEGLDQNLDIEIAKQDVEIVAEDVKIASALLQPDLSVSVAHTLVDDELATASNGQAPENKGSGSLQLNQIVYSEQATANRQIQLFLLEAQKAALEAQSLDIVLDVSTTYLNLMQAKTAELIQRENLELTRKNLELARVSSSLGQSGPSDLYRWQGEIATAKSNLLNATAQRKLAEMALNQILNRPISEEFLTVEIDLEDSRLVINNETTDQYVTNPRQFYRFADFLVSRAKANTPNLKLFDHNVQAQERALLLNQRNRYIPTFSLGGAYNKEFYRGGSGTEFPMGFPTPNDWNWSLQVGAAIPIFQGGSRLAQVQQSKVQLTQLNTQRLNTERLVEQQVRSQLENIRASYTNIQLTQDAEDAVVRNFELIQDSYSKGAVTITQLLDAQNAAISAQLNSANAVYILLLDLLNMERATGTYYMLMDNQQKADYVNQLTQFFQNGN